MDAMSRIERAMHAAIAHADAPVAPPKLAEAISYSVFPGGARVRPRLCLAVASACGDEDPAMVDAAAIAIELLHCASLVHDDLPCFDDAPTRRGKPSVHAVFGEPLAVLAGDALIVLAFETLVRGGLGQVQRLPALIAAIGRSVGMPSGIVAGQAWESEPGTILEDYQRAKTGALFVAATTGGALASGADPAPWRRLGECIGEAYQVADDLRDAVADPEELGKPVGRDAALGRPNAVAALGIDGAVGRLDALLSEGVESIPPCAGWSELRQIILMQAQRLVPKQVVRSAA